jgi:hypothetical protein
MRAIYRLMAEVLADDKGYAWTELTEAEPLCRARIHMDAGPEGTRSTVIVNDDGSLKYDPDKVEVEYYKKD